MKTSRVISAILLSVSIIISSAMAGDISPEKAAKIGKKEIKKLTDHSYHYRVEYDTIIILPVHSKIKWKDDFYLLYFLKDDFFQAEIEVNKMNGDVALLSIGKISKPYYELHTGMFAYRYFNPDSVMAKVKVRHNFSSDSARLVYFGIIPKLGKRGVIWELFSGGNIRYQTMDGMPVMPKKLIEEINHHQRYPGNFTADEIRYNEILAEVERVTALNEEEWKGLNLSGERLQEYIDKLDSERKDILVRFPELGKPESLKKKKKKK